MTTNVMEEFHSFFYVTFGLNNLFLPHIHGYKDSVCEGTVLRTLFGDKKKFDSKLRCNA